MAKLILRCNYLKNDPMVHLQNFIEYLGIREGVEKVSDTRTQLPATAKQTDLIQEILTKITDAKKMHEYHDYLQNPSRENATEFITQALENNLDLLAKKKNYVDYLANRPRAEKIGTHGLFSNEGEAVILSRVADEIANHTGVIWTNVISLRREDAERLGFDRASEWQSLIRSRIALLSENFKIDHHNLKWYAAFHNESHHPHVHLVVYSTDPSEGYLTKKGIEAMRSVLAHDIFRQDFMSLYEQKTEMRKELKVQAEESLLFLLKQLKEGICHNKSIDENIKLLSRRLMNTSGKKVYGYLQPDVKAIVNSIVDELTKEDLVAACYQKWMECQEEVYHIYKDTMPDRIPLSEQPELKSIKNVIIREAVKLGEGQIFFDDERFSESEKEQVNSRLLSDDLEDPEEDTDLFMEAPEKGTEKNDQKAERYFLKASKYGNLPARYKLAQMYLRQEEEKLTANPNIPVDYRKIYQALAWLTESADKGTPFAASAIGRIYADGILIAKDMEKAITYLTAAADQENQYAQYKLGRIYLSDEYQNIPLALNYLTAAADQNSPLASYRLGKLFLSGETVPQDTEKAIRYLILSADQGSPYAQYLIGKLCLIGKDIPQDQEKGFSYLQMAAGQGNIYAAYLLEHWQDWIHPDFILMATRLLHHMEQTFADSLSKDKSGGRGITDRKQRRKTREKKISQGHARDDHSGQSQTGSGQQLQF